MDRDVPFKLLDLTWGMFEVEREWRLSQTRNELLMDDD